MAIFLQGDKPAILWNPKENKPWFAFHQRRIETENPRLIHVLRKYGYEQLDAPVKANVTPAGNIIGDTTLGINEVIPVARKKIRLNRDLTT